MNAPTLSKILQGFLDPNQETRKQAESTFAELKANQPDELGTLLCQVLRTDPNTERRQQAAITIRNFLRDFILMQDNNVWLRLQPQTREFIKTELLNMCVTEPEKRVKSAIADIVLDIGECLLSNNGWDALPPTIMQMINHPDIPVQIIGLDLAAGLSDHLKLAEHVLEIKNILRTKFETQNIDLIVSSINLICNVVADENCQVVRELGVFLPSICQVCRSISKTNDDHFKSITQVLIDCCESAPEYFKSNALDFVNTFLQAARDPEVDSDRRQIATELLLTFVSQKPKHSATLPGFFDALTQTLMEFMLDVEEDKDWLTRELTAEDDDSELYMCGEFGMDRLASVVSGEIIMPIIFQAVGLYLQQQTWKHKIAAILTICQSVEYLPEECVESQLAQVIDMLLKQTRDQHHRVRFAACRALAQTALDHQPFAQEHFHQSVLPALLERMDDTVARVQAQAFAAFVNYAEEVDVEDLIQYVPAVMNKIFKRLSVEFTLPTDSQFTPSEVACMHKSICEQCITSVAVIAGVLGERMLDYTDTVVPLMKSVVQSSESVDTRQLRGRALECLSIIAYSVGLKNLQGDSVLVVRALLNLYKANLEPDDPVREYVYEALRRMAAVMGRQFSEFNNEIVEQILKNLQFETVTCDPNEESQQDYTFSVNRGDFSAVKTSKLEQMELDLQLLTAIVEYTKGHFVNLITPTINAVVPLLDLQHSKTIRRLSLLCVAELIGAARDGSAPRDQIQSWVLSALNTVIKVVNNDAELSIHGVEHLTANVAGLTRCLEEAGSNVLSGDHVTLICEHVWRMIEEASARRAEMDKSKQSPNFDAEDCEQLDEEKEREQQFRETCLTVLEAVLKHHPIEFMDSGAGVTMDYIRAFINPSRCADDRTLACYVSCDILEHLGIRGIQLLGNCMQFLLQYTRDQSANVRQAACYAMALCMSIPNVDAAVVSETAKAFMDIVSDTASMSRVNRCATENAVAGLTQIVITQAHTLGAHAQVLANLVLDRLPLRYDEEEGLKVHKKIFSNLQNEQSLFWGSDKINAPKIVGIMGAVYKSQSADDETDALIMTLARALDRPFLQQIVASNTLTELQKRGLRKIERDFS